MVQAIQGTPAGQPRTKGGRQLRSRLVGDGCVCALQERGGVAYVTVGGAGEWHEARGWAAGPGAGTQCGCAIALQ